MRKALRRALVSVAAVPAATLATVLLAIPAGAATGTAGPNAYSPVEAGYSATGTNFKYAKADFTLPDPTLSASYVSRIEFVSELWSPTRVTVLGVYAATNSTVYHPEAVVYNPKTKARICATWSTSKPCPGTPASWNTDTFAAGDTVQLSSSFAKSTGTVNFAIQGATTSLSYSWAKAGTAYMTQVRLGAEFGCTPWGACGGGTNPSYTHPSSPVTLATVGDCVITTSAGKSSGYFGAFTYHKVKMTLNGVKSPTDEATIGNLVAGATYPGGQFDLIFK
jgi:hypothetical protein